MIAVALCAVLLVPVVWVFRLFEVRENTQRAAAERAMAEARRALYAAQIRSALASLGATKQGNTVQPKNLWAALTANHSTFKQGQTEELRIEFSLVNDGDEMINPQIADSQIMINGKELTDSGSVFGGIPKDVRIKVLASGESIRFSLLLGNQFKETGTYWISWKGSNFQSSEMVVRILPETAEKPK
jgi:hypothetical protein